MDGKNLLTIIGGTILAAGIVAQAIQACNEFNRDLDNMFIPFDGGVDSSQNGYQSQPTMNYSSRTVMNDDYVKEE